MLNIVQVPQYSVHEYRLESSIQHDNPFTVTLNATMIHESGVERENIPGFYDGDGEWVIRFSPNIKGRWTGKTISDDPNLSNIDLDPLECVDNPNPNVHGVLGIDPQHPQRFAWEDGTPFVALGFECDWLFSYHQEHPDLCRKHVELIKERGFNYIVMNVYAHTGFSCPESRFEGDVQEGTVYGPPRMYCFGGTNDNPDHTVLNTEFFKDYDRMMMILHELGIVAHLMIQVQNKRVNWPPVGSPEDDRFWRYVVARYQAFGNVVWDVGKESYNFVKKTGSHDYTLNRMNLIRETDAYDHLVTVHDPEGGSAGRYSPPDLAADFCSDQVHLGDVDKYNREAICKLRLAPKPYMNIEYGYELGAENLKTYRSGTSAPWQKVLMWTYAIFFAGAYPTYYYSNTAWDLIKFDPEPEGWIRYRYLMDLLNRVSFNEMESRNEMVDRGYCLANPGYEYLVFLPEGGDVSLDLSAFPNLRREDEGAVSPVKGEWMNIFTGDRAPVEIVPGGWSTRITNTLADTSQPCVLLVKREET